jgi:hypothetical protein
MAPANWDVAKVDSERVLQLTKMARKRHFIEKMRVLNPPNPVN